MYVLLDYFFIVFHALLVGFNLFGWVWRRTRRAHLAVISMTLMSWFGLGLIYGWGYCPCTDWHWRVKEHLGAGDLPYSYVKYYADKLTGRSWDPGLVDAVVVTSTFAAFAMSCLQNLRDWKRKQAGGQPE